MKELRDKLLFFYSLDANMQEGQQPYQIRLILWESGFLGLEEILPFYENEYPLRDKKGLCFISLKEMNQFCESLGVTLKLQHVSVLAISDFNRILSNSYFKDILKLSLKEAQEISIRKDKRR